MEWSTKPSIRPHLCDWMGMRTLVRVLAALLLAGCGSPNPSDVLTPCVQQSFRAELHVDPTDDRRIWATDYATGQDFMVKPHSPAVFVIDPSRPTTVLNSQGNVFSFAGEIIRTACVDLANGAIYIGPEDIPDPNRSP